MKLVLFDLVGTLVDEASDYDALDAVMKDVVQRFAIDAKPKDLSGEFSLALMEIIRGEGDEDETPSEFIPFEKAAKDIFAAVLEFRGFKASAEDVAWFWAAYLAHQRRHFKLYPEAKTILADLKTRGIRSAVVTDADAYLVKEILPVLRLKDLVEFVVSAEEAGHVKPHPSIFRLALARANVVPEDAVMVGDSYERDIEGARAAGIRNGILVDRHRARRVDVPTIASLKRLPRLVAPVAPAS